MILYWYSMWFAPCIVHDVMLDDFMSMLGLKKPDVAPPDGEDGS